MEISENPVRKVFVVLDPHRLVQPALQKAEWVAERNQATLELYCCVYDANADPGSEAQSMLAELTRKWIERIAADTRGRGIDVNVRVEVDPDWRKAVTVAASADDIDLVVKTASPHGSLRRRLTATSDWTLLGSCKNPVALVNPRLRADARVVLAAVKLRPDDDTYVALNQSVLDLSKRVAAGLDAELHAVTVYRGQDIYFDRQKFADSCGLPRNRVHGTGGAAYDGIAEVAARIGAGIVVVGQANRRSGLGNTAQRVIDEVDADVLILPED